MSIQLKDVIKKYYKEQLQKKTNILSYINSI